MHFTFLLCFVLLVVKTYQECFIAAKLTVNWTTGFLCYFGFHLDTSLGVSESIMGDFCIREKSQTKGFIFQ